MVTGKKKWENWGKGLRTRWKSCGRRKYKWGEQQGEVVCSAGLLRVGSSRRRGWRCGGEAGSPASAPHSLHGSPPAPSSSVQAQRCRGQAGEQEQGAGEAEAGSHPPGTHGKGSQGSSQMAPSIPTLAAPPGTAALGAPRCAGAKLCWKKNSPCCFRVMFTSSVGFSAVNTRGQQVSCLSGLVQCLTRWGFGLKNERWVIVCLS